MSMEEKVLDISRRLARELGKDRESTTEKRTQYAEELDSERKQWSAQLEEKRRSIEKERCSLGHAKARVHTVASELDDEVLELNVGGRIFASRRSTLCLYEGSYLANLFSGRWESSIEKDDKGRFFLDFDPDSFRLLLNFLRSKRLESSVAPAPPPDVPPEVDERFQNLIEYLGLTEHLLQAKEDSDAYLESLGGDPNKPKEAVPLGTSLMNSATRVITALRLTATQAADQASAAAAAAAAATAAAAERQAAAAAAAPPAPAQMPARAAAPAPYEAAASSSSSSGPAARRGQNEQQLRSSTVSTSSHSTAQVPEVEAETEESKGPGWSKKVAHLVAVIDADDPLRMRIGDTRALAAAAAVRSTRGFQAGKHSWEFVVELNSDWSYVGFVSQSWTSTSNPIGRAAHSWGVASNGTAYSCRQEVGELERFTSGSRVGFVVDMDDPEHPVTVIINGKEFPDVFKGLPAPLYPAVSNCRSPARYYLNFEADR